METMKKYRQLIRVTDFTDTSVDIVVPGCGYNTVFTIDRNLLPYKTMYIGKRFFAKVNLEAETDDELDITDFEPDPMFDRVGTDYDSDLLDDAVNAYYHQAVKELSRKDIGTLEERNWFIVSEKCKAYFRQRKIVP